MATDSFARWPELDAIFEAALELDAHERPAFLDRSCGGDSKLRRELELLLSAADASSDFLEDREPLLRSLAEARREAARPQPETGQRIGAYRLIRQIGHGGMGRVYLAERADGQFEQRAALKVLGGWAGTLSELRRFERERQILARLQHPNIARLLDGGVTEDGRPYFVMDYVDGTAIDLYCDEHRLGVRRRLELFLGVCSAIEFAHRNLIVHRDIKPGNALVTADGIPKLLDFGIAGLLRDDGVEAADFLTRTGLRPMTPEYASPEMVRSDPVGMASDVYQLGALLYQLLTGRPPYRFRSRTTTEIERVILTAETERPSSVVTRPVKVRDGDLMPEHVARARSTKVERLRRRLRGDLDNIVLAALRKEPERRYGSVEQLAEDVRRHLDGRPVRARPDTLVYRSSRFVRRHRFGVGSGIVAAVLLVGFAVAMGRQAERTARERDTAEQVTGFMVDLFRRSDPYANEVVRGDTLTVRRVLEEGPQRLRTELADQPKVRATLLGVIGSVYRGLGLYDEARPLLEEAVAIRRRVLDPEDPELGSSLSELGELHMDQREYAAAEPLLEEALRIARASRGERDTATAGALHNYAFALHVQGRVAEAESLYRAALTIHRRVPGPPNGVYPVTLSNLGWILMARGDYAGADSLLHQALAIRRRIHPAGDPRIANSLSSLAYLLNREEHYVEAEPLAREALRLRRALFGDSHALIADALLALAGSLAGQRRLAEAESLYRESLAMFGKTVGEGTPDAARVLSELGLVLADLGRLDEAERLGRQARSIYENRLGAGHLFTVYAGADLASILVREGRYDEAERLYRDGVGTLREEGYRDHPDMARLLAGLGRLEMERGEPVAAEPQLRKALEILQRTLPAGHPSIARARGSLGECLLALERYSEAEPLLLEAYRQSARLAGGDSPDARGVRAALIRLYEETGRAVPERLRSPGR